MAGFLRHCWNAALPMKPVLPVMMTFILFLGNGELVVSRIGGRVC